MRKTDSNNSKCSRKLFSSSRSKRGNDAKNITENEHTTTTIDAISSQNYDPGFSELDFRSRNTSENSGAKLSNAYPTSVARISTSLRQPMPSPPQSLVIEKIGSDSDSEPFGDENVEFHSDDEEDEDEQCCVNCEVKRLRHALKELHNIENGYVELLDKLDRNLSDLEIRSQGQQNARKEFRKKEKLALVEIVSLHLKIAKLENRKRNLVQEESAASEQEVNRSSADFSEKGKTLAKKTLKKIASNRKIIGSKGKKLNTSISKPKMRKMISHMRSDLERRRKRMEMLEECFGSGRSLESETKAQLGYLPSSLRYFPENKSQIIYTFIDDADYSQPEIDPDRPEIERVDSAETFNEIMAYRRVSKTKISKPELELLFDNHTSTSDHVDSSNSDSEPNIIFSSSCGTGIGAAAVPGTLPLKSNLRTQDLRAENSSSQVFSISDKIDRSPASSDMSSKYHNPVPSEPLNLSSMIIPPFKKKPEEISDMKKIVKQQIVTTIDHMKYLPKGVRIPTSHPRLAQPVDINSNIGLYERTLAAGAQYRNDSESLVMDVESEFDPIERYNEYNPPPYLYRSSLTSSSLDDPRDYSVIDFPFTENARPKTKKNQKKQSLIPPKPEPIPKLKPEVAKILQKTVDSNFDPFQRSDRLPRTPRDKKLPVTKTVLINDQISPRITKKKTEPKFRKKQRRTATSGRVKFSKLLKEDIASLLYPHALSEVQKQIPTADSSVKSASALVRQPFQISLLDLIDAIEQRKRAGTISLGAKTTLMGPSIIMDIKTLHDDIINRDKKQNKSLKSLKDLMNGFSILEIKENYGNKPAAKTRPISTAFVRQKSNRPKQNQNPSLVVPKRCATPVKMPAVAISIAARPTLTMNYLKPCDRVPKKGGRNDTWAKTSKPIPVREMPSYLRFGMFNGLRGRSSKKGGESISVNMKKNSMFTKTNTINDILQGIVPEKSEMRR